MVHGIVSSIIVLIGSALLAFGLYSATKLRRILVTGELKRVWDFLSVLIVLFILAYMGFIGMMTDILFVSLEISPVANLLLSVVFGLGGAFVAATAYFNYRAFR